MDISEVVHRSGIPPSALRFYEEKGLIASVGRRGLHRVFSPDVLDRLAFIALGRAAGFSLAEIATIFRNPGRPRVNRRVLATKAEDLDRTIKRLTAVRDGLRHAAACPAPSHIECPTFRRLLRAASIRVLRRNNASNPEAGVGRGACQKVTSRTQHSKIGQRRHRIFLRPFDIS